MTPAPPIHEAMPEGFQIVFTGLIVVLLVPLLFLVIREGRRTGDAIPALCILGGAVAVLNEPLVDMLALVWYPIEGNWEVFKIGEVHVPVLTVPGYAFLYGAFAAYTYLKLRDGLDRSGVYKLFAAFIAVNAAIELFGVRTGVYYYYGDQPLEISKWPLTWGFLNCSTPVVAGLILHAIREHLVGRRLVAVVLLIPFVNGALFLGAGFPTYFALHGAGVPWGVTQVAGIATCVLGTFGVWLASLTVPMRTRPSADAERHVAMAS